MARRTRHTYRGYVAGQEPQPRQEQMFGAESLPLWSQTTPPGRVERFVPKPYVHQDSFTACRVCRDTGHTSEGFCTCPAGQAARARESKKKQRVREPTPPPQPYIYDDTSTRIIQVRNDPRATKPLDPTTAIDVAIAHLGREVDDWELDDVDEPNDRTVLLQFTRL